jgi:hypothetical protein
VQAEVEAVAAEDVAHVVSAHDHQLQACLFGDSLQTRRAHLARRSNGEAIARDDKRLPAVDALAKVRHQVAERSGLPLLVEGVEAFGHTVGRRRDLISVDRVEFFRELGPREALRIPEDECPAPNQRRLPGRGHGGLGDGIHGRARLQTRGLDDVHKR